MKVLLIPLGSAGDVHPFLGIGRALQARGHHVTMVANGYFEPQVRRLGLGHVELGTAEQFRAAIRHPDAWHPRRALPAVAQFITPLVREIYHLVERHYVPGETVAVAGTLAFGARVAQDRLGVPTATVHLQPSLFRSVHDTSVLPGPGALVPRNAPAWWKRLFFWLGDVGVIDRLFAGEINAFRGELGLPPVRRLFDGWIHSPQRVIGLFPDWFAPPQPDWPPQARLTGFPLYDERDAAELPGDVRAFLDAGAAPVAFTPGSANCQGRAFFDAALDACRRLGRRGVFLTRFPEQLPPSLPADVRHFDFVPLGQLLPRCAALVHHGGIGTCAQGLACGVPQLVMPMSHDQPDNAARLTRLGVAAALPPRRFRGPAVAAALDRLLGSAAVAARCREVADRFAAGNGLEETCRLIEELAGRPRPAGAVNPVAPARSTS